MDKFKKKFIIFSLIFIGVFTAFLSLEVFLRLTEKRQLDYTECTSLDSNFHHVMIPNSECRYKTGEWDVIYKINNSGLRDREISEQKSENEYRVLVLGDSFTQGHGIEVGTRYVDLLEEDLQKSIVDKKVEVVNSGVFAYSPIVEYLYLIKEGLRFQPDLVILAFTITDFWDDRQRFGELKASYPGSPDSEILEKISKGEAEFLWEKINVAAGEQKGVKVEASKTIFLTKQWLRKNIRIYKLLADFVKKRDPVIQQDAIFRGDIDRDIMAIARGSELTEENWQKLWDFPMFSIEQMNNILKKNAIPFIVVAIPDAIQVSGRESPNRKGFGFDENYSDPRGGYQTELAKRLSKMDVPFIDLLTDFRKSNSFPLYFTYDMHWTALGHELGAEMIFKELKEFLEL